ncbi:hypothetical protein [Novosphingobium sp.]|uniref:hypothetical protein n=1 Tax=Novosphingobium sp. TaxID=1874826 RepID=UPI0026258CA2|nr:hypothetical protein [Novosphingobium sp.]
MATRAPTFRFEEAAGLVVAVAVHAALILWLALKPPMPAPLPAPQRMTVTFADEVALQSTSPKPAAEAAPAVAPVLSENPVPDPAPEPKAEPRPAPPPVAKVAPRPEPPKPAPLKPVARPVPQSKPQAAPAKPATSPVKATPAPARPAPAKPAPPAKSGGGGSRLGDDFLKGLPGGQNPSARDTTPPAVTMGPQVKAALSGAIARQLKPKWAAPQGAEADQLVTVLSWDLNPDGTLAGPPRLVSQSGVTDANRPQAQRHVEQAMRAVRLAAPFDLPSELYPAWKRVKEFRFDRKLSQ